MMPDCIIPAAGLSSRMGSWKPGLPWGDSTVLEQVMETAAAAGCRVILVGGHGFPRLRKLASKRSGVVLVRAWNWRRGMGASLRRGIREVRTPLFFVTPADMPLLKADVYQALVNAFPKNSPVQSFRPVWNHSPGHPILMDSRIIAPLLAEKKNPRRFREFLKERESAVLPWTDPGVITDLDTPEKYREHRPKRK